MGREERDGSCSRSPERKKANKKKSKKKESSRKRSRSHSPHPLDGHKKLKLGRECSSSSGSEMKNTRKKMKKSSKKKKKKRRKEHKKLRKVDHVSDEEKEKNAAHVKTDQADVTTETQSQNVSKRRPMIPMTKEEHEKQQSIIRRVYDPETGRNRLVKGDGEILEEIVSYARHKEINKMATQKDGEYFSTVAGLVKK